MQSAATVGAGSAGLGSGRGLDRDGMGLRFSTCGRAGEGRIIAAMSEETSLWKGGPSQWLNIGPFTAAFVLAVGIIAGGVFFPPVFAALVLPLAYALWKYLVVRMEVFELTDERLLITSGVLNQKVDEIELYRIKDSQLIRTWWMRPTGLSSILLDTSDRTMPKLVIPAIRGGREMRELLRKQVEIQRDKKRVREMDFDDAGDLELEA
jgi:uncharacterized membrane protein YdbT with pleckstrin-like domain